MPKKITTKQSLVLKVLQHKVPRRELGIRSAYYKIQKENSLDFLFIVEEDRATLATGYIRALFSSLEKSLKDIEIDIAIHVHEVKKESAVRKYVKKESFASATLVPSFV